MKDRFKTETARLFDRPSYALAAFPTAHFMIQIRDSWARINDGKSYQPVPCDEKEIKFCQSLVDKGMAFWVNAKGERQDKPVHLKYTCKNEFHLAKEIKNDGEALQEGQENAL